MSRNKHRVIIAVMKNVLTYIKLVLTGALSGIILNILIGLSGIESLFPGYEQNAAPALYSVPAWTALILYGFIMPFLEEAAFRLFLFSFLRKHMAFIPAALISSAAFGIYHLNAVQFIYAFIMGLIISCAYEKDHRFRVPFIVHASANLAVYSLSLLGIFS